MRRNTRIPLPALRCWFDRSIPASAGRFFAVSAVGRAKLLHEELEDEGHKAIVNSGKTGGCTVFGWWPGPGRRAATTRPAACGSGPGAERCRIKRLAENSKGQDAASRVGM